MALGNGTYGKYVKKVPERCERLDCEEIFHRLTGNPVKVTGRYILVGETVARDYDRDSVSLFVSLKYRHLPVAAVIR